MEIQYDLRSARSTWLAMKKLVEHIMEYIQNKNFAVGFFIDLKKAFDMFDHNLLIYNMEWYGMRGVANNQLKSFLDNRQQYVHIGQSK